MRDRGGVDLTTVVVCVFLLLIVLVLVGRI
jgi:hypothetical protein